MSCVKVAHLPAQARNHAIRLVVKATGHDYLGRSVAPNSLSIWTHHMKGMEAADSFDLHSCGARIDQPVVTAMAGSNMEELQSHLDAINRTIVGGGGKTVGIMGYVTSGGHGLLSARYGLAADQVVEMEAVTPMGEIVTLNECQNSDLFWAMRGVSG